MIRIEWSLPTYIHANPNYDPTMLDPFKHCRTCKHQRRHLVSIAKMFLNFMSKFHIHVTRLWILLDVCKLTDDYFKILCFGFRLRRLLIVNANLKMIQEVKTRTSKRNLEVVIDVYLVSCTKNTMFKSSIFEHDNCHNTHTRKMISEGVVVLSESS